MKIEGGGSGAPIDLNKVKAQKENELKEAAAKKADNAQFKVDAKLSQTLSSITSAIEESGLTAGELHSNVDEGRALGLLESFDRVGESKQPRLEDDQILDIADKLSSAMLESPEKALDSFKQPSRGRVEELLS